MSFQSSRTEQPVVGFKQIEVTTPLAMTMQQMGPPDGVFDQRPGIAIILLNFKGWQDTLDCVDSLLNSECGFRRLVICDNASPDDSLKKIGEGLASRAASIASAWQRWGNSGPVNVCHTTRNQVLCNTVPSEAVTLIDNELNLGFAAGNNIGLKLVLSDPFVIYFWLLNNDTEVDQKAIGELLRAANSRPQVDLWGTTVVYHHDRKIVQALGGGGADLKTANTWQLGAFTAYDCVEHEPDFVAAVESQLAYPLGASMFATRRWIEMVGLLGEQYFLYYEEIDWALRGKQCGLSLGYASRAVVFHKEGGSIGTAPSGGSLLSIYHLQRSKIIFARLHLSSLRLVFVFSSVFLQALKLALKGRIKAGQTAIRGALAGLSSDI